MNDCQPSPTSTLAARATAAVVTALLAFALPWLYAATIARAPMVHGIYGDSWVAHLKSFGQDVASFAAQNNRYPESLEELRKWANQENRFAIVDKHEGVHVPGGEAARYEVSGRSYRFYEVFPNGQTGEYELTGDLDRDPKGTVRGGPTLHDFFYNSPSDNVAFLLYPSLVMSLFAGLWCWCWPQPPQPHGNPVKLFVVTMILLVAVALAVLGLCGGFLALLTCLAWRVCCGARQLLPRTQAFSIVLFAVCAAVISIFLFSVFLVVFR